MSCYDYSSFFWVSFYKEVSYLAQNNEMEKCWNCHTKIIRTVTYSECNCLEESDLSYMEDCHKKCHPELCQKYEKQKEIKILAFFSKVCHLRLKWKQFYFQGSTQAGTLTKKSLSCKDFKSDGIFLPMCHLYIIYL